MHTEENDITDLIYNVCSSVNLKIAFLLYIAYIVLNTDSFNETVLYRIDENCYDLEMGVVTSRGYFAIGLFLIFFYIIIDLLDQNEMI